MALPVTKALQVLANSSDVSSSIDWASLDVTLVLTKEVSTFKFNVKLYGSKYVPSAGDQIDLYETIDFGATATGTSTTAITGLTGITTASLIIGMVVIGTHVPGGAYISAITGANSFTLSSATTGAISSITFQDHRFGGTITEVETILMGGLLRVAQVTCTDWGYQMASKLVVASYGDMDPADIVAAIVPAGYDATTYVQRAGYTIPSIKFNYEDPTKCLQALASLIGWNWYIDADKRVHFFLVEPTVAPFPIDDTTGGIEWTTLDVDVNLQNMKNSVFVIGGVYDKILGEGTTPDVYLGNGTQMAWGLVYAYTQSSIAVLLNGVAQSVGIANQVTVPVAFDVIYDPQNRVITFNTAPTNGATIQVFGTAEIPIVGHAIDQAAVAEYGEFQDAIFDANIKSIQEAQMRAQAEILLYGHAVYDVKFSTRTPGLRIGQTIIFNSTQFGVSNYPLIVKRIEGTGRLPTELEYAVECIGSDQVTFVDIMTTLLQQENSQIQVDNTTLEPLLSIPEPVGIADVVANPTHTSPPYLYGTAVYNLSTWS